MQEPKLGLGKKKTENKLFASHTSIHLIVQLAIKSTTYGDVIETL